MWNISLKWHELGTRARTTRRLLPWYGFDNVYSLFKNSSISWPSSDKHDFKEAANTAQSMSKIVAIFANLHSLLSAF